MTARRQHPLTCRQLQPVHLYGPACWSLNKREACYVVSYLPIWHADVFLKSVYRFSIHFLALQLQAASDMAGFHNSAPRTLEEVGPFSTQLKAAMAYKQKDDEQGPNPDRERQC